MSALIANVPSFADPAGRPPGMLGALPAAIDTVRNALPPDALAFVEAIEEAYATASDLLSGSALPQAVGSAGSLQAAALAVIEEALQLFAARIDDLAGNLIDPQTLQQVRDALAAVEAFRADFPAHRDQFLPFIARNLVGVPVDLLHAPLDHLRAAGAVVAALEPAALAAA